MIDRRVQSYWSQQTTLSPLGKFHFQQSPFVWTFALHSLTFYGGKSPITILCKMCLEILKLKCMLNIEFICRWNNLEVMKLICNDESIFDGHEMTNQSFLPQDKVVDAIHDVCFFTHISIFYISIKYCFVFVVDFSRHFHFYQNGQENSP